MSSRGAVGGFQPLRLMKGLIVCVEGSWSLLIGDLY